MWNIKIYVVCNRKQRNSCSSLCQTYNLLLFQTRFPKSWPTDRKQVVVPRHQTPQGQSFAKPGTPLLSIMYNNVFIEVISDLSYVQIIDNKGKNNKHRY